MIKISTWKIQQCLAPENREVKLAILVTLFLPLQQAATLNSRMFLQCITKTALLRDAMCQNPSYGVMSLPKTVIETYLLSLPLSLYA